MVKLGKRARKFARKNLPSLQKRKRKFKSMLHNAKNRRNKKGVRGFSEHHDCDPKEKKSGTGSDKSKTSPEEEISDTPLENLFDSANDAIVDASDSDGFLTEDEDLTDISGALDECHSEEMSASDCLSEQNSLIQFELKKRTKKLRRLQKKHPGFLKFLEKLKQNQDRCRGSTTLNDDEDGSSYPNGMVSIGGSKSQDCKTLTTSIINNWCLLVGGSTSTKILANLLNGFRAACHCGTSDQCSDFRYKFECREAYCRTVLFVLKEADGLFRRSLGISNSSCKKQAITGLENSIKWKCTRRLIKSYLRSALFLMNQITDSQVLEFVLSRLRCSAVFFADFHPLAKQLIEMSVRLWFSGEENVSFAAFSVIRELCAQLDSDCLVICLVKSYKAFMTNCRYASSAESSHSQFLVDSVVELYSIDMHISFPKVLASLQHLAQILQIALNMEKQKVHNKIDNWQFINCIYLWVNLLHSNSQRYDLQLIICMIIRILNGVVHIFTGLRYLPLKFKCIKMLNKISQSTGVFVPVSSLILGSLEHSTEIKPVRSPELAPKYSLSLKVPKQYLKSYDFQEWCIISAIKLLAAHFSTWSLHISFPEVATIPLLKIKRLFHKVSVEHCRHCLKNFISQVEQNVEYVQKKRDAVSFSPKDAAAVNSFLKGENDYSSFSWHQYYNSILQDSLST